jgi:ABC-2 type transport system permease protein
MGKLVFFKKEINEILKTSKKIILPAIFLFFAIVSPLTARYMKEILSSTLQPGMEGLIPDPTYIDSYVQFFKNFNSICIIAVIFTFVGSIANEKEKGSAVLVLTKKVSRFQFIMSKFAANVLFFTVAYLISAGACIYYTFALFPEIGGSTLWLAFFMYWTYGVFMISIAILASTLAKSYMVAAVLGFLGYIAISLIGIFPDIVKYTPAALSSLNVDVIKGTVSGSDMLLPIIQGAALSVIFVLSSVAIFKKQEI